MKHIFEDIVLLDVNLALFGAGDNVNATVGYVNTNTNNVTEFADGSSLSQEMRTYYSDYLIDMAEPELIHDQFGQKHPIPKNGGKEIQFRKYDSLPKMLKPLDEGVTPDGQKLSMSTITQTVKQYGGYIELSDMLLLTAVDNNLVQATKLLGSQAGRTLDTITREVLNGGTNVLYAGENKTSREDIAATDKLTVNLVRRAVRILKIMNAPRIDGYYVAIVHPDCVFDLMDDPDWKNPHQYQDTSELYEGELGKIAGVRFVECNEAKVFMKTETNGYKTDIYSTLILGDDAYGVTEISGGGLQHIVKQLGSAGTADPLNQRATVGWKATKTAVRLVEQYMVRIESGSSFSAGVLTDNENEYNFRDDLTDEQDVLDELDKDVTKKINSQTSKKN